MAIDGGIAMTAVASRPTLSHILARTWPSIVPMVPAYLLKLQQISIETRWNATFRTIVDSTVQTLMLDCKQKGLLYKIINNVAS